MQKLYNSTLVFCLISAPIIGVMWILSVPQMFGMAIVTQQIVAVVLGLAVAAGILSHPYLKSFPLFDLALALIGAAAWFWYAYNFKPWMVTMGFRTPDIWIPGIFALVLMLEALRKSLGLSIALLIWVIIAYGLFGDQLPGMFEAAVFVPTRTVVYLYADTNGVPGLVITVIVTLVLPFVLMGKVMQIAGGMTFFNNLALGLVGHRRGGPAKVAIVASGFFGSMSGSTVANIMSTGVLTIPMMIRSGMTRVQAAAIEAVASNGGQIAPPIMGATAFIMAEVLQIPYSEIVQAAAVPAALYYLVLFFKVDSLAIKNGLTGLDRSTIPPIRDTLKNGWEILIGVGFLMYLLFATPLNPGLCALIASVVLLIIHAVKIRLRYDLAVLKHAILSLGQELYPILLIGGAAGIVIGLMNSTGFAFQLSLWLTHLASNYGLFALLLLSAFVAIILGMGMPTSAVYIVLVTVVAPSMIDFGVQPLAAHMFLLYFGLMSMVTPPIAIGSIVAARLAGANMWAVGFLGMRLGIVAYFLPIVWVYNPALLLQGTPIEIAIVISNAVAAAYVLKLSILPSPIAAIPDWLFGKALIVIGLLTLSATALTSPNSIFAVLATVISVALILFIRRADKSDLPNEIEQSSRTAPCSILKPTTFII